MYLWFCWLSTYQQYSVCSGNLCEQRGHTNVGDSLSKGDTLYVLKNVVLVIEMKHLSNGQGILSFMMLFISLKRLKCTRTENRF